MDRLVAAVVVDGSRTFLLEIQVSNSTLGRFQLFRNTYLGEALCLSVSTVLRQVNGIQGSRPDMIILVSVKQAGLKLPENVTLLLWRDRPQWQASEWFLEWRRGCTVAKLGYKMCIVPRSAEKALASSSFDDMVIVGCRNLKQVINTMFTT